MSPPRTAKRASRKDKGPALCRAFSCSTLLFPRHPGRTPPATGMWDTLSPMSEPQISNRLPLALERVAGKAPDTVIFRFDGPFTARAIFANQSPDAVDKVLDLHALLPSGEPPTR